MQRSKVDSDKWIRCGKCGHKLAKITGEDTGHVSCLFSSLSLEMKCHSCKTINVYKCGGEQYEK